jgi:ubiquinone/menaquinone biosynthesis C-methylase UbiE
MSEQHCLPIFSRWLTLICLCLTLFPLLAGCADDAATPAVGTGVYEYRTPSAGGTGKIYLGRQISQVMGHNGAAWLDRAGRELEERTDLLIDHLPLDDDDTVADIGAGTGYFTERMARRVPSGRVYAVDIEAAMLEMLSARITAAGLANVVPVQATVMDPQLPADTIDLALMVDAYHEFSHPFEVMTGLGKALKHGGRVVLVEYRGEDPAVPIKRLHKMTQIQVRREMAAAGLEWESTGDFLPQQHFMVFRKP